MGKQQPAKHHRGDGRAAGRAATGRAVTGRAATVSVALDAVTRRFGRVIALDRVSFDLHPGEVVGLLGPNGAGKTTTMRVLTGYLRPTAGRVLFDGVACQDDPRPAQRLVGYMPEGGALYPDMTVQSYLRFCGRLRRVPRRALESSVDRAVAQAGLARVASQRIGTLSRGYRRRVALAQALVHDPPVLVLDEPTAGLDPRQVTEVRELIAGLGRARTVLLSSHLLSEVSQLCRRVVVLDQGRIVTESEVDVLRAGRGGTRIEIRVSGDAGAAARCVSAVEGVRDVTVQGRTVVVRGEPTDLAARLSRALIDAGHSLLELRTAPESTLEDAYLRLVGDS